jgi:hypothetical protein
MTRDFGKKLVPPDEGVRLLKICFRHLERKTKTQCYDAEKIFLPSSFDDTSQVPSTKILIDEQTEKKR